MSLAMLAVSLTVLRRYNLESEISNNQLVQPKSSYPHNSMVTRVLEREESPFDIKSQVMKILLVIFPGQELTVAQLQEDTAYPLES